MSKIVDIKNFDLYNLVNSPIAVFGEDFSVLYCNKMFLNIMGNDNKPIIGTNFLDYIFKKDREILKTSFNYIKDDGQEFETSFRLKTKSRGYIWFSAIANTLKDENNIIIYVINLFDIYSADNDDIYGFSKNFINHKSNSFFGSKVVTDEEGNIIDINEGFLKITQTDKATITQKKFVNFIRSPNFIEEYNKEFERLLSGEIKESKFDIDINIPNDDTYHSSLYIFYLDVNGTKIITHSLGLNSKEIFEYEKIIEEKTKVLKLTERISGIGHWQIDTETEKLTWSEGVYRIHELEPSQYIPEMESAIDFYHPEDRMWVRQYIEDAIKDKEPFEFEFRIITESGKLKHVFSKAYIRFNSKDEVESIFGILQDLSEIKESEHNLEKMVEELRISNQELERFAYFASHDMQEPLRTINSFTDILKVKIDKLDCEDEDIVKYFDFIQQSARQLQNLVKDLVDYSKSQELYEKREEVDINKVVEHVIRSLSLNIESEHATIKVIGKLPVLYANRGGLSRLIQNIVSNSLKYRRKEEPPKIEISATESNNCWAIHIKDNGIGMDEKYKNQIFNPFKRLHNKFEYSGSGIGLAVCKKIVDNLGGEIGFTENEENGVTFTFVLPQKRPPKKVAI